MYVLKKAIRLLCPPVLLLCVVLAVRAEPLPLETLQGLPGADGSYVDTIWTDAQGRSVPETPPAVGTAPALLKTRAMTGGLPPLPPSYDARTALAVTPVRTQGASSGCWAMTAIGSLESNLLMQGLYTPAALDLSEAHLIWFAHRSLVLSDAPDAGDGTRLASPYTHGGNWLDAAATLARWSGPALEADFPYSATDLSAMGGYAEEARFVRAATLTAATRYYYKPIDSSERPSAEHVEAVKRAILTDGAVQVSFYSEPTGYYSGAGGTAYYQNRTYMTSHAVLIVGWDDAFPAANFRPACQPAAAGAWLCRNNWGTSWGDGGYFWMSYEEISLNNFVGFTATDADAYERNYQYDGFGFHGRIPSDAPATYGNVFTAEDDELLCAAGVYFLQYGASYTLRVYRGLSSDYASPIVGEPVCESGGTAPQYGYFVLPLPEKIPLRAGERFSVVVTVFPNGACPRVYVPVENVSAEDYVCASLPGQSFLQIAPGGAWYDASVNGFNNVCVKALTVHRCRDLNFDRLCDVCDEDCAFADSVWLQRLLRFFRRVLQYFLRGEYLV